VLPNELIEKAMRVGSQIGRRRGAPSRGGLTLATAVLLLSGAGCRDLGTEPEGAIPATILLDRDQVRLGSLGETTTLRATVLDQFGREISGTPLIWFVDDPSVATIESDNRILARRNGATTVQVVVDAARSRSLSSGYYSGRPTASVRVEVRQEVGTFAFTPGAVVPLWAVGQGRQMSVEVRDPLGSPFERAITIQWESTNPSVAEVTPEGRVFARDDGSAQVRAVTDEGAGAATVQVATRFSFSACVSSSASRLASNLGSGAVQDICADTPLRAFAPDSVPAVAGNSAAAATTQGGSETDR
jgi:hypothetical protein